MLLEHFDSIVLVSGGNLSQEHFSESSFSNNCEEFHIANIKLELNVLGWIRKLRGHKYVEWTISVHHFWFILSSLSFVVELISYDLKIWNSKHYLGVLRSI